MSDGLDSEQPQGSRAASARFFDRALDLAAILALDGRVQEVNAACARALGRSPDELRGMDCAQLVHPDDLEASEAARRRLAAGEAVTDLELRIRDAAGSTRTILWSATPGDELIFASGKDVTTRLRREQAAQLARDAFEGAFESAPIGMAVADLEGRFLQVNPALSEMLELPPEALLEDGLAERVEPAEAGQIGAGLRRLMAGDARAYRGEHRLVRGDGATVVALVTVTVMADADGNPFQAFCQLVDVTESRLAEEELRESTERLTEAQRVAQLGSWEWDVATNRVTWSDELFRIYGLERAEFVGTFESFLLRIHPEDRDEVERIVTRSLRDRRPFTFHERIVRPDGEIRSLRSYGEVLLDAQGNPVKMIGVCQDVTDEAGPAPQGDYATGHSQDILDSAGEGILGVDSRGRATFVNAAAARMLGWEAGDLVGRGVHAAIQHTRASGEPYPADECPIGATLREGTARRTDDDVFWRRDGTSFPVEIVSTPITRRGEVTGAVVVFTDITERKRAERQLRYLADHDPLTGLFNRRRFAEELERTVAEALRYGHEGAVLMLDLDAFKVVNDRFGHQRGDELITNVGRVLRNRLRNTDILARLGGDEFAVILPQVDLEQAETVSDDLLEAVREATVDFNGAEMHVTTSVGIAVYGHDSEKVTGEELLERADAAMYRAKEAGRDRWVSFGALGPEELEGAGWGDRIRRALERDGLVLVSQPIVRVSDRSVSQHELLLRLRGDDGRLIEPGAFLPAAERLGLVQELDRWVVRQAVRLLASDALAEGGLPVEVNLSSRSIADPELPALIERELLAAGVDPSRLIVDVSEPDAVSSLEEVQAFATAIKAFGARLALDDFGTGFGSFAHLRQLPLAYVKIDGDFIRNLTTSATDRHIVEAIVRVTEDLGQETIAEYVSDEESLNALARAGVRYAQGYHLGPPEPLP